MSYLNSVMDYIFFFYGLAFLVLAAVCFVLGKYDSEKPAWRWLGLFGLTHGINEWLDMLAFVFSDTAAFALARTAVMAFSFLLLLEFGRRSMLNAGRHVPGGLAVLPLMLLIWAGWYYGPSGLNAMARYSLGLPGALLAAFAMFMSAVGKPAAVRRPLLATAAGLACYALAAGVVAPEAGFIPARWLNHAAFSQAFGFPVQLLRALLALYIAGSAWLYLLNRDAAAGQAVLHKLRAGWAALAGLLLVIAAGWLFTDYIGEKARRQLQRSALASQKLLSHHFTISLQVPENAVASMSGAPWISGALADTSPESVARGESVLARYCGSFKLSVCYLISLHGVTVASTNRHTDDSFIGKNYGFRPYFTEAIRGRQGRYFAQGVTSGKRGYYASHPVRGAGAKIIGAAVIKNNMEFLSDDLNLFPYAFLVSPEGIIFVSSDRTLVFRSLWPGTDIDSGRLARSRQYGSLDLNPIFAAELHQSQEIMHQGAGYYISRTTGGLPGWSLITFAPLRPVYVARFSCILGCFVAALCLLGFFLIVVQLDLSREEAEQMLRLKEDIRTLTGIVPICASCKKIRDDKGYWNRVETYVAKHTHAQFSHGLCEDCARKLYPGLTDELPGEAKP